MRLLRRLPGWGWALIVVVAVVLVVEVLQALVFEPFVIPSASMLPTLRVGQRIIVSRWATPHLGQVVVFHPPAGALGNRCAVKRSADQACARSLPGQLPIFYVKRVVGVGGDRIAIKHGEVYRNGVRETLRFINRNPALPRFERASSCPICNLPQTVVVPRGQYFLIGDNRGNSDDSRLWGPVPRADIIGPMVASYWPPDRMSW
jgi:signal peptidase I